MQDQLPRRIRLDKHTPAEKAITDAMCAVEDAGCDPLLSDAVCLLADARNKVADFVDGVARKPQGSSAKPTIGRIVHYYPQPMDRWGTQGEPTAAVICRVFSDDCVNLRVFADSDDLPLITSVVFDEDHSSFSWSWPPRA